MPSIDVQELIQRASLTTVRMVDMCCHVDLSQKHVAQAIEIPMNIEIVRADDGNGLGIKVGISMNLSFVNIEATAMGDYKFNEPLEVDDDVVADFIEQVAFSDIFPYLRQGVSTLQSLAGLRLGPLPSHKAIRLREIAES